MNSLYVARIGLTVRAKLPRQIFEQYLPAPIEVMSQNLAEKIDQYVQQHKLGYYPALDYFKQGDDIPAYLLDAADQISTVAMSVAQQQVLNLLQPVFSSVRVESMLSLAYALPPVRPGQSNGLQRLTEHLTPDTVKFELYVTLLQKHKAESGIETSAKKIVWRWLGDLFEELEITTARLLEKEYNSLDKPK